MAIECYDSECLYHSCCQDEEDGPYCYEDECKKPRFQMTVNGCLEAKTFLRDTGNLYKLDNELSTDGYTIVTLANSIYDRMK